MLPRILYELLPLLYLVFAILLIVFFDSRVRWIPAGFFLASGVMVLMWRLQKRRSLRSSD